MLLIVIVISFLLIIIYLILNYKGKTLKSTCDYLLVLGAKVIDENTPCKALEGRLIKAIDYLKRVEGCKVVVCGGVSKHSSIYESHVMKRFLVNHGIDIKRIIVEDRSTNTFENLKYAREILYNIDKIIIISSKYHLFRASILAKRAGFKNVYLIGSDIETSGKFKNVLRELFAVIKSIFLDW